MIAREKEAFAPVLAFDYDLVVDGRKLERPVNYALVRIHPPEGTMPPREDGRPWVIIDPRAGHGSGIGGFKSESEVGVALRDGHPVYFIIFYPEPVRTFARGSYSSRIAVFRTRCIWHKAHRPNMVCSALVSCHCSRTESWSSTRKRLSFRQ